MAYLEKVISTLNGWLKWMTGGLLMAMMLLPVANMVMRKVWMPFAGTTEVIGWLAALVAAFALSHTQRQRGHASVEIMVSRFPPRAQAIINSIMFFVGMVLFGAATWQIGRLASRYWEMGSLSESLHIVFFPFIYAVALGCALLCLTLLVDFLKSLTQAVKR